MTMKGFGEGSGMTTQRYTKEMRELQMETITSKDGTPIAYQRS